jgi:hypothetical protein
MSKEKERTEHWEGPGPERNRSLNSNQSGGGTAGNAPEQSDPSIFASNPRPVRFNQARKNTRR